MSKANLPITESEWDVMLALWECDEQTAGEVIAIVQQSRDWNHRTIRTLLTRLVEKGAVDVRVDGNKHFYRAAVSREACVRTAARSFTQQFFAGDVKSLLLHFVEHEQISEAELEELKQSLSDKSKKTNRSKRKRRSQR